MPSIQVNMRELILFSLSKYTSLKQYLIIISMQKQVALPGSGVGRVWAEKGLIIQVNSDESEMLRRHNSPILLIGVV